MERACQTGSVERAPSWQQGLGPSVLHAAIVCSLLGVIPGQVCFTFPAPSWEHEPFPLICPLVQIPPQLSTEPLVPDIAPRAPKPQFHLRSTVTLAAHMIPSTLHC